ncbi:MAG: hypothetical protein R6V00_04230 [Candidatus Aminicenantes bacterium]
MRTLFNSVLFLLVTALTFAYATTDVSGEWEVTIKTQEDELVQSMRIEQDGESLYVIMEEEMPGAEMEGEGTIKDNNIEWSVSRSTPQGQLIMSFSGKVEGDSMSGVVMIAEQGLRWTAVRK